MGLRVSWVFALRVFRALQAFEEGRGVSAPWGFGVFCPAPFGASETKDPTVGLEARIGALDRSYQ